MKRQFSVNRALHCLVLIASMLLAGLAAAKDSRGTGAAALSAQKVTVCVSSNLSPQIFARQRNGQPVGYLVDVLTHAAAASNWQLSFSSDTAAACKAKSVAGEVDLVYPLDEVDPESAGAKLTREHIDFSWARVYALERRYKALDDLAGARVGLWVNDLLATEIPYSLGALGIKASYQQFPSFHAAIDALHEGRVDVVAGENTTLFIASDMSGVVATPLRFALKKFFPGSYSPASFPLLDELDTQLDAMHGDASAPIYKRYSHWISPDKQAHIRMVENLITGLVVACMAGAFALAWLFRRRMRESDSALVSNSIELERQTHERELAQRQAALNSDRFQRLSHATQDIIFDWDIENNTYWQNEAADEVLGSSEDIRQLIKVNGNWFQDRLHEDDRARVRSAVAASIARRSHVEPIEFRLQTVNGDYIHVLERIDYTYNEKNMVTRALVSLTDVSALHQTMSALVSSEQRYRSLVGNVPGIVMRVNLDGRVIEFISNAIQDIIGVPPSSLIGKPTSELAGYIHPEDLGKLAKDDVYEAGDGGPYLQDFRMVDVNGLTHWVSVRTMVIRDEEQQAHFADMTIFDVTDFVQLSEQLNRKAVHDDLTGLLNRKGFERIVDEAIGHAQAAYSEHSLCHIDIDQFKAIQEQFGYSVGDQLLRKFSRHLMQFMREDDKLACLGGDRFALLLSDCASGEACRLATDLLEHIRDFQFPCGAHKLSVSASIGQLFITWGMQNREVEAVMGHADTACYMAKARGGNRVQLYSVADTKLSGEAGEVKWYSLLKQACEDETFELHYEPMIALSGSAEQNCASLKVCLADHCEIPTECEDFKWVAERHGFSPQIELWAVEAACDWLEGHSGSCNFDMFTLPISAATLANDEIRLAIIARLAELSPVDASLCFEIGERAALENLVATGELLGAVAESGCKAALVCYDSGLSSFSQLKTMKFDFLKSEGHGSGDMVRDVTAIAMVRALNEIAHALGMRSIVSHVENESTLRCLRDIPVDFVQGGYFGDAQPLPANNDKPSALNPAATLA